MARYKTRSPRHSPFEATRRSGSLVHLVARAAGDGEANPPPDRSNRGFAMSLRLRRWAAFPAVLFVLVGVLAVLSARADTVANFAIDGQIQRQAAPDDWAAGSGVAGVITQARNNDGTDRKSTRLNSSHANISYAVFCLKKKKRHAAYRC